MKLIYLLIFLLTFLSQNAFSQDYSKMSANEKAKVIIYGNDYPYSLLLENGSDTLSVYVPYNKKRSYLIFEDGKLTQIISSKDTTTYFYENDKIKRCESIVEDNYLSPFIYIPIYRNDSLIGFPIVNKYNPLTLDFTENEDNTTLYYNSKWTFYKDKITTENMPSYHFPEKVDIQRHTISIEDDYVVFTKENILTKEGYENEYCMTDFLMTEKHEIKFKILKSPKDKPKREKIVKVENDID
ncbi:hypothetical protein Fleli_2625 [Bernardetia litoralis DSM 6794]|uniref:Uncharacterized protein n=1 Tax=Bernardetia litoralis (strain ATCC 23117 / DSM 6794 / NBRC 15988 / NCIMB 1366 / Fx l1 / Sio-4) TaxID=880071 RepID=I4AM02_BERLS|nr:hypothetical protein [Bernardetia litoralis]AFM04987.1 hypothetical protein Fleli_2625 [Bernardetia litoralis DSM 6794]